ncbi:MAG: amino acid ABC transporter substrate-binding protein, partial [Candidatus Dormiibacterota bacterium]
MTRQILATTVGVVMLAAAGVTGSVTTTVVAKSPSTISGCAPAQLHLFRSGRLTVATDSPAYTPWFEHNQPKNGEGYESAVAYAIAAKL